MFNKMKKVITQVLLIAFLVTNIFANVSISFAGSSQNQTKKGETQKKEKNQIIVKYKNESNIEVTKSDITKKLKLKKNNFKKIPKKSKTEIVDIGGNDLNKTLQEISKDPNVEYVQPDYKITPFEIPSDPQFNEQWGLNNFGQAISGQVGIPRVDINVLPAWNITRGSAEVVVGVLDSGIDTNHDDLSDRIYVNQKETVNGIDDDGNGYVDDISGWDFANRDNTVYDSALEDKHGTHVAGVICASSNNKGIVGVAPNVKILPLKFISGTSGYTSDAILAIEYAKSMGVKILNCSWGGAEYNPALKEAMQNSGILFVCAAGNNGNDISAYPIYPASLDLPNIVTVAALDNTGKLASFSNYGNKVHIAAPGQNILSTVPENKYSQLSGTSMAAPYVCGIASLLKSKESELAVEEIADRIKKNVVVSSKLTGKVNSNGRSDAHASLTNIVPQPEANASTSDSIGQQNNNLNNGNQNKEAVKEIPTDNSASANNKVVKPLISDNNSFYVEIDENNENQLSELKNKITDLKFYQTNDNSFVITWHTSQKASSELYYGITQELKKEKKASSMLFDHSVKLDQADLQELKYFNIKSCTEDGTVLETGMCEFKEFSNFSSKINNSINQEGDKGLLLGSPSDQNNKSEVSTLSYIMEVEPNDYIDTAMQLSAGTVFGKVSNTSDYDWYKVTLDSSMTYSISLKGMAANNDFDLFIYDSNVVCQARSNLNDNLDENIEFTPVVSGTYYIRVISVKIITSTTDPNSYQLMFYPNNQLPDTYEPNDTMSTAKVIEDSIVYKPTINTTIDEDWFEFNAQSAGKLNVNLTNVPFYRDYDMAIYDASGNMVGGSFRASNYDETYNALIDAPGKYYIRVYSYIGCDPIQNYQLKAAIVKPDIFELNENFYGSKQLNLFEPIAASIDNERDEDWYHISLEKASKVHVKFQHINMQGNYGVVVYDTNGQYVGGSYQSDSNGIQEFWLLLNSGNYKVRVYASVNISIYERPYNLYLDNYSFDSYELNENKENATGIAFNQTVSAFIDNLLDQDWYKVDINSTGVLSIDLKNLPKNNDYGVEVYDCYNNLVKFGSSKGNINKVFMSDIQLPGSYYIKVFSHQGYDDKSNYSLTVKMKEKIELIERRNNNYFEYDVKINNPKNIRTATLALEYDPLFFTTPKSSASNPLSNPTGLKTIAIKTITGTNKNIAVYYYDMENDLAVDMEDQEVIIDTVWFSRVPDTGSTTISLLPESNITCYDSKSFVVGKRMDDTIEPPVTSNAMDVQESFNRTGNDNNVYVKTDGLTLMKSSNDALMNLSAEDVEKNYELLNSFKDIKIMNTKSGTSTMQQSSGTTQSIVGAQTVGPLYDQKSFSSIYGGIRVPAGSGIRPEQILVVLRNSTGETRCVYPNNLGKFIFDKVPAGDYYIKVERDENIINSTIGKPIIVTNEKHIGTVDGTSSLFVQDLGYYYNADFNSDNHMNDVDANLFMDTAAQNSVEKGNILNNTSMAITDLMPYSTANDKFDTNSDGRINSYDSANTITGCTWNDPLDVGIVDTHNYKEQYISDTLPSQLSPGSTGTFTVTFKTECELYSEELKRYYYSKFADYSFYVLERLDNDQDFITSIENIESSERIQYDPTNERLFYDQVTFTIRYWVSANSTRGAFVPYFRIGIENGITTHIFGKGFSKVVQCTGGGDWYKVQTEDNDYVYFSNIQTGDNYAPVYAFWRNPYDYSWNAYLFYKNDWIYINSFPSIGVIDGYYANGNVNTMAFNLLNINIKDLQQKVLKKILYQVGLEITDLEPEDLEMLLAGTAAGLDDNYFFGFFAWTGHVKWYYDDFYFCTAKVLVDSAAIVHWASVVAGSHVASNVALANAEAAAAATGLAAATGVGTPVAAGTAAVAIESAIASVAFKVIAVGATAACSNSTNNLKNSIKKLKISRSHSKILRDNLKYDPVFGMKEPSYKNAAHHIVAWKDARAAEARDILRRFDIGIDDAVNGVFLPTQRGVSSAAYHPSLHTNAYYTNLTNMMRNCTSRKDAIQALTNIRKMLLNGTFPH
ncbi:MAG: S8 family serine peptidase [Clostridia bacterium]|nr:S8 family serine peptidase [Clostridia bacterium]